MGAVLSLALLDPTWFAPNLGWRFGFGLGALLSVAIVFIRRSLPESPRWLLLHNRHIEAEQLTAEIERFAGARTQPSVATDFIHVKLNCRHGLMATARTLLRTYPKRTILGLVLFIGQAFLYNSIFFTQALVLTRFFRVPGASVSLYIIPLALGNFVGPLLLGSLFDRIGRRAMIAATFALSGILLVIVGVALERHALSATTLTVGWSVVFFFASAAASSAYLTVSEIFPLEIRALAIALFYAVGTSAGGILGPVFFGIAIERGTLDAVAGGYYLGALLMIAAGIVELVLGVEAARRSLEHVAEPLSQVRTLPEAGDDVP